MSNRDNNAYRLDMFSSNPVVKRRTKKTKLELIPSNLTKQQQLARKKQKQVYKTRAKVIFAASLFLTTMIVMVYSKVILNEKGALLHGSERELSQLKSENTRLNNEVENKYSDAYIIQYAETQLGMIKITSQQINYINHETDDRVEIASATSESFVKNIFSTFKKDKEVTLETVEDVEQSVVDTKIQAEKNVKDDDLDKANEIVDKQADTSSDENLESKDGNTD